MRIQIVGSGSAGMHFMRAAQLLGHEPMIVMDNNQEMLDSLPERYTKLSLIHI